MFEMLLHSKKEYHTEQKKASKKAKRKQIPKESLIPRIGTFGTSMVIAILPHCSIAN
jgi:hypothetical protein